MVATHELCRIIESGFVPLSCTCTVNADRLLLTGVSTERLTNVRAISNLIGELRTEIKAGRRAFAGELSDCARTS